MIARTVVGFVFVPIFGYYAVCAANPTAWILADIFLIPAYLLCVKKLRKTIRETEQTVCVSTKLA